MHCMTNDPTIPFHCRIIFGPPTVAWPRSCPIPPEPFFCVPQYASVALLCVRSGLDAWRDGGQSSLFWGRRGPPFSTRPDLNRDKKTCLKTIPRFSAPFSFFFFFCTFFHFLEAPLRLPTMTTLLLYTTIWGKDYDRFLPPPFFLTRPFFSRSLPSEAGGERDENLKRKEEKNLDLFPLYLPEHKAFFRS